MKSRVFWAVLAVALVGLVGFRVASVSRARAAQKGHTTAEIALVRSAKAVPMDLADKVAFTGTVRPHNEVEVFAKVAGRIERLEARVGDRVRAGQVLAVVEHREIAWQAKAAEAAVALAKANVDGAKLELDRTTALFEGGSAPAAQLDGAKVKLALAQAQLAQAEASAGLAHQQLANATIVAPIDGTIVKRPVTLGAQVSPASPIVTLQDVRSLKVEASIDADAFARLAMGAAAQVRVDALPGESFAGKVSQLSPSLDAASRRAALELQVANESGRLLPNMFAQVEVTVGEAKGSLAVPREAVYEAAGGPVVFRIKDGHVQTVRPKLGGVDGQWQRVLDGLAPGDEIATSGLAGLADGVAVKTAVPTASR